MYMKVSVVTKFYDAQNIQKYIQSHAHFINIQSFFICRKCNISTHVKSLFLYTETTQKLNKFLVKKYLRI
jgi:hypothetical protein